MFNSLLYTGNFSRGFLKLRHNFCIKNEFILYSEKARLRLRISKKKALDQVKFLLAHFSQFLTISADNMTATVNIVMGRNLMNFLMTTMVPTVSANILGHCTNFFGQDLFDLSVSVNLTIMLVITTM